MSLEISKMKIIMVEDDEDLRFGWNDIFAALEYNAKIYANSNDLLAEPHMIEEADLLITDYYLPDLNGVELAKKVRSVHPDIPVIMLTGSREPAVIQGIRSIPHTDLLFKPLSIDTLLDSIEKMIKK